MQRSLFGATFASVVHCNAQCQSHPEVREATCVATLSTQTVFLRPLEEQAGLNYPPVLGAPRSKFLPAHIQPLRSHRLHLALRSFFPRALTSPGNVSIADEREHLLPFIDRSLFGWNARDPALVT